ncbi:hypothetical protein ETR_02544 [Erwinia tracheiphila PSU-1]|nr:hypothetical protein ETR_02544 [Erwinia tracheiphila PSU-1]
MNAEKAVAAVFKGYRDNIRAGKDYLLRRKEHQKRDG